MSRFRAVGFDLDRTLFDHSTSARIGVDRFLRDLGVEPTPRDRELWFAAEEVGFAKWSAGELTFQEQRRFRLRSVLPQVGVTFDDSDENLDATFDVFTGHYRAAWQPFHEVPALLRELRAAGKRVGILTNGSLDQQLAKVDAIGIADLVDVVCAADEIGFWKPDPRAFHELCRRLGVEASETVFVGDHAEQDVAGARAAGLLGVLVDQDGEDGPRLREVLAQAGLLIA